MQHQMVDVAGYVGWTWVDDTLTSSGFHHGFPDLILAKPERILTSECTRPRGRVSDEQRECIDTLGTGAGVTALIAWPD